MHDLKEYAEKITQEIIKYLSRLRPEVLRSSSSYLIVSGGKKLRSYLLIKVAECYGLEFKRSIYAAIAVELLHNFSLIHDDIMDNDELRHGKPTVHVVYGIPLAILAGDTLFSLAFNALGELMLDEQTRSKLYRELSLASLKLSIGQAHDIVQSSKETSSFKLYYEVIKYKTAALFECSAAMGAILGGAYEHEVEKLREIMRYAGMAFQIKDDILGVFGDPKVTGKPIGNDIREGKKTLIFIYAKKRLGDKLSRFVGNKNISESEMGSFIEELKSIGAYDYALERARLYERKALSRIETLSNDRLKDFLRLYVEYLVERKY